MPVEGRLGFLTLETVTSIEHNSPEATLPEGSIPELLLWYLPGSEVMITPNDWPTIVAFCTLIGVLFVF